MIDKRPKNKVARELYERFVKGFKDVIVLKELENGNPIAAHDVRALIYKRFHILISFGTVYSLCIPWRETGSLKA